ncbi:polysaccharide pyruvyl transferase family protein [Brevibacterium sp. GP-SGM9]|uniref:polysaccharide pyruvyl transferase family protein n=1 Tax=Brevibacterium sp. GP-SGM9 TaxID=3376990 RepID=UPI0039A66E33
MVTVMGKRYLMRLGKTPFELADGFETLDRNTIGRNNGNLIFGTASHKLFSTEDTVVDANRYRINKSMAARVNDEYDGFILPLANAFRPGFEAELTRTAEFIEKLAIPFLMLSGGAQLPLDGDSAGLKRIEPAVKRFARAVLDKSSALTVRGELTAEYLKSLGFDDVLVVGCPSMTMNGRGHSVDKTASIEPGARIAYNLQTSNPFGAELIDDAEAKYDATYLPQDSATLELMLWGTVPYRAVDDRLPLERTHPQFAVGRAEFQLDAPSWIRRMSEMAFAFGPRIHGNIAAILAGTPGIVLAHDGRTLELSKYHGIPAVDLAAEALPITVAELYAKADFAEFNRGHAERFDRLSGFIHENGFTHIYDSGQERARTEYEDRIASTDYPPAQTTLWRDESSEFVRMAERLQLRYVAMKKELKEVEAQKSRTAASTGDDEVAWVLERLRDAERRLMKAESELEKVRGSVKSVREKADRADRRVSSLLRLPLGVKNALGRRKRREQ